MPLKMYNTLNNQIETFIPIKEGKVGMYMCGPTVYNHAHIGNFRSNLFQDLVKRFLLYSGYDVTHIMNITDIDDKIIKKAIAEKKPISDITKPYVDSFFEDLESLNILKADNYPRATEHIKEMTDLVNKLIEKGFAYKKGDSVYFNISKYNDYGSLANIEKENLKTGVSVDADEYDKDNVQDFVLWKGKKLADEPSWDTDFGEGRPGWHLECSAMSTKYLGNHFDIHLGGVDLIFPHHENEIAQSECSSGEKYVNYWLHCQHLVIENKKMSKSLGNFYTLKDLLKMGYSAQEIRYVLISAHYRKALNFTFDGLKSARQALKRIHDFIFNIESLTVDPGNTVEIEQEIAKKELEFKNCLDDDFNISGALAALFETITYINKHIGLIKSQNVEQINQFLGRIDSVLGVINREKKSESLDETIQIKIEERNDARKAKDFAKADEIRDELKQKGISLIDTPEGVKWKFDE